MSNLLIITTCLISIIKADLVELPHAATTTTTTTTLANSASDQQQLLQIFTSLAGAIKLSFTFFKYIFSILFTCIATIISPLVWIFSYLWSIFVTKPFNFFMHVAHVLYPVALFCIAAVFCGLLIGGCAGFASEAFSSILISATWGPQSKSIEEEEGFVSKEEGEEAEGEEEVHPLQQQQQEDTDDEELYVNSNNNKSTASSSIWERSSTSFFGVHQNKSREKEPLNRVESWRDSLDSSVESSPVLIRRMKLSSTTIPKKKQRDDGWEWDEDEDEVYQHQRQPQQPLPQPHPSPSSSTSFKKKHFPL